MNATAAARDAKGTGQRTQDELAAGVARFLGERSGERPARIARLETGESSRSSFNPAAALLGPLWAASRGLWTPFWARHRGGGGLPHRPRALLVVRRSAGVAGPERGAARGERRGAARGPRGSGRGGGLDALAGLEALAARGGGGGAHAPGERGARGARRDRPRRGLHLALRHPRPRRSISGPSPPRASSSAPPRRGSTAWSTGW